MITEPSLVGNIEKQDRISLLQHDIHAATGHLYIPNNNHILVFSTVIIQFYDIIELWDS